MFPLIESHEERIESRLPQAHGQGVPPRPMNLMRRELKVLLAEVAQDLVGVLRIS